MRTPVFFLIHSLFLFYHFRFFLFLDNKFICDCKLVWIKGLRTETVNQQLKDSLDMLTCFLEGHNKTINNAEAGIDSANGNVVGNNGKLKCAFVNCTRCIYGIMYIYCLYTCVCVIKC